MLRHPLPLVAFAQVFLLLAMVSGAQAARDVPASRASAQSSAQSGDAAAAASATTDDGAPALSSRVARAPASLSSIAASEGAASQGEQMLRDLHASSPTFLSSPSGGDSPVRMVGVCRSARGMIRTSLERDYVNCIDGVSLDPLHADYSRVGAGLSIGR